MKKPLQASRKLWIFPPILIGGAIFAFFVLSHPEPERLPAAELARRLSVIQAPAVDVLPRALGYGTAQPGKVWRAVLEVEGRVVSVHPELKTGEILRQGTKILQIDLREYELAVRRLQAELEQVSASLLELTAKEANYRAALKIEEASLAFAERALARTLEAAKTNAVSATQVDEQERTVLAQRQRAQSHENLLNLLPTERKSLLASRAVKEAHLEDANLDLAKTSVQVPFDCRLAEVNIQEGQYLAAGELLFEAHGIALTEVEAQVPLDKARALIDESERQQVLTSLVAMDMEMVRKLFSVDVIVRQISGDFRPEWKGRFARVREVVDPQTRTLGMVVAVDKPYEKIIPGERPPLVKGAFCEVELRGKVRPGKIVIPRTALHGEHVYVVNATSRLERRKVEVAFRQSNFVCLETGLEEGETLVVADLTPGIEGMLVEPVPDDSLLQALVAEATGQSTVR